MKGPVHARALSVVNWNSEMYSWILLIGEDRGISPDRSITFNLTWGQVKFEVFAFRTQPKLILLEPKDLIGFVCGVILKVQAEVFIVVLQGPRPVGLEFEAQVAQVVQSGKRCIAVRQHLKFVLVEVGSHIFAAVQSFLNSPSVGDTCLFGSETDSRSVFIFLATGSEHHGGNSNYQGLLNVHHRRFCSKDGV